MPTTIHWENKCEKCSNPVNVVIKTHCCDTLYSLVLYYNEMKSLDLRRNVYVEGTSICKGCIYSLKNVFDRQIGKLVNTSSSLTSGDVLEWMKTFNDHFDREDCLLDLPDIVTVNITKLSNLILADDRNEIFFKHVLYTSDD